MDGLLRHAFALESHQLNTKLAFEIDEQLLLLGHILLTTVFEVNGVVNALSLIDHSSTLVLHCFFLVPGHGPYFVRVLMEIYH